MTLYSTLKSFKCNYVNECYGGFVDYQDEGSSMSNEH